MGLSWGKTRFRVIRAWIEIKVRIWISNFKGLFIKIKLKLSKTCKPSVKNASSFRL